MPTETFANKEIYKVFIWRSNDAGNVQSHGAADAEIHARRKLAA